MGSTGLDASLLVAAFEAWHEHHEPAITALNEVLASDEDLILPSRALLEAYAVLTRLPPPHRLAPRDAIALLRGTLEGTTRIVTLPTEAHWDFLEALARENTLGGATYDADIVECCRRQGVTRILTLNAHDFERLAPAGLEIWTPI